MGIRVNASVLVAILLATAGEVQAGATARWTGSGVYGADDVVLENEYLTVTIRPHRGGRVVSFVDKPSRCDLAHWRKDTVDRRLDGGLFRDIAPSIPHPGEQKEARYAAKIDEEGPARAAAVVSFRGASSRTRGVVMSKRFILPSGVAALAVELEMANLGYGTVQLDWRSHHWLSMPGILVCMWSGR